MPLNDSTWEAIADLGMDAHTDREWFEAAIAHYLRDLATAAASWPFGQEDHLWQQHQKLDFARWLRKQADIAAPTATNGSCEGDCQTTCAYPGQFTECAMGVQEATG